jgi:hypothetical protein
MTDEFNDRVSAQRSLLRAINSVQWAAEPLFGLSRKAIDRWINLNGINASSALADLVLATSSKLFFLANKSQEQVSEEYQLVQSELIVARDAIARELSLNYGA